VNKKCEKEVEERRRLNGKKEENVKKKEKKKRNEKDIKQHVFITTTTYTHFHKILVP
jgi:hypothetical protein